MLAACGYRLGTGPSPLLAGIRTIHVPPLANASREPGAGAVFARGFRETLAFRTGVRLASRDRADAILEGRVLRVDWAPMAFPTSGTPGAIRGAEFRSTVRLRVSLRRKSDGRKLFDSGELTFSAEFLRGQDVLGTEANRERALRQAATDAARQVADLLSQAF